MSDASHAQIERCRLLVAQCRVRADALTPSEKQTVLIEIDCCEQLIALAQSVFDKPDR
jgi:hypothetical protein